MNMTDSAVETLLADALTRAVNADVFGECKHVGSTLSCAALESAEEAFYRLRHDATGWHVELVTADRWLSESIEADLMHLGDPIEELIEEELIELGEPATRPEVKHYRSDDMLYTFRTPLGDDLDAERAVRWLMAYEAAFRELGDMQDEEDE